MSISLEDIKQAEILLRGKVTKTPLLESDEINDQLGGRVLFKAECLQKTGSFKIRGATNKLASLNEQDRKRGVVAFSSGNHAQGVALAAQLLGISAKILIPQDAPAIKIVNTRAYGAEVILYDRYREDRAKLANDLVPEEGRIMVSPYDDETIIAGQGTVGLELVEQLKSIQAAPDILLCPCGGGGLVSGVSTAILEYHPNLQIYAVEPDNFDDTRRSLLAEERLSNVAGHTSICDSIVTERPGEITFPINQKNLHGGISVSDDWVVKAMKTMFIRLRLVLEPGGAVGLAALLSGALSLTGRTAVVILSGGNIDLQQYIKLLHENK
jgi:threonine dehydratase